MEQDLLKISAQLKCAVQQEVTVADDITKLKIPAMPSRARVNVFVSMGLNKDGKWGLSGPSVISSLSEQSDANVLPLYHELFWSNYFKILKGRPFSPTGVVDNRSYDVCLIVELLEALQVDLLVLPGNDFNVPESFYKNTSEQVSAESVTTKASYS